MNKETNPDWDPRSDAVLGDQIAAYDAMRQRCPAHNLLYGAGIHVCPGAPLARLELRIIMEELLQRTSLIALVPGKEAVRMVYPGSGFAALPLRIKTI